MVSRQETALPLLTQGEVIQLVPNDELVLASSMAPIRAKKLRYYEDPHFKARILPPPSGGTEGGAYPDRPMPRPNDWGSLARRTDARLEGAVEDRKSVV